MKSISLVTLAWALAIPAFAQDATNKPAAELPPPIQTFSASDAVLTAPLLVTNDYLYLPGDQAVLTNGGKAVFTFTVTNAGDYVIESVINAPSEDSNSFYLNIDAQPTDPDMIWDMEVTGGFEKRMVGWRGNGDSGADEFPSKHFKLAAGAHNLIIIGREPGVQLKSLAIHPAPPQ